MELKWGPVSKVSSNAPRPHSFHYSSPTGLYFFSSWQETKVQDWGQELDIMLNEELAAEKTRFGSFNPWDVSQLFQELQSTLQQFFLNKNQGLELDEAVEWGGVRRLGSQIVYFWSGHYALWKWQDPEPRCLVQTLDYLDFEFGLPSRGLGVSGVESLLVGSQVLEPQARYVLTHGPWVANHWRGEFSLTV